METAPQHSALAATKPHPFLLIAGLGILCCLSIPLAVLSGAVSFPADTLWMGIKALVEGNTPPLPILSPDGAHQTISVAQFQAIIFEIRLPRILLTLFSGAGLAMAGVVLQGILSNPLADPFTLGISSGAAFGAALAITLGLGTIAGGTGVPLCAFIGAALALGAVLLLGKGKNGASPQTLILAGVVVSAFLSALITLVKALNEDSIAGIVFWIMGSFSGRTWTDLALFLPGFLAGGIIILLLPRQLDILSLGCRTAKHLGLSAGKVRLLLLVAASAITASCVAIAGIIGFIGLIVPHLCRLLLGADSRILLPASAFCGAFLLLWSDVMARSLLSGGAELPVGVITALLGGPFFCLLLVRTQKTAKPPLCPMPLHRTLTERAKKTDTNPTMGTDKSKNNATETASTPSIRLEAVTVTYPGSVTTALDSISLHIEATERIAILGPNGSGKSTLLHCIAGLIAPQGGSASVAGVPIHLLPEKKRAQILALLQQRHEHIPSLSAFSLALMGRFAHTPFLGNYSPDDAQIAAEAMRQTGAFHLAERQAPTLSGGELQRVLLSQALTQQTPVILLDEVTAGLDLACQRAVLDALVTASVQTGGTVVASLHDLNIAALYFSRLVFLKNGKIIADGPVETTFTREIISSVYETDVSLVPHPTTGQPQILMAPFDRAGHAHACTQTTFHPA